MERDNRSPEREIAKGPSTHSWQGQDCPAIPYMAPLSGILVLLSYYFEHKLDLHVALQQELKQPNPLMDSLSLQIRVIFTQEPLMSVISMVQSLG